MEQLGEVVNNNQNSAQFIQVINNQPSSNTNSIKRNIKPPLVPAEISNHTKHDVIQSPNVSSVITDHYYTIIHKKPRLTAADSTKSLQRQQKKQKQKRADFITSSKPNFVKPLPRHEVCQKNDSGQGCQVKVAVDQLNQMKRIILPKHNKQESAQLSQSRTSLLKTDETKAIQQALLNNNLFNKIYNEQKRTYQIAPAVFKSLVNGGTVQIRPVLMDETTGALKNIRSSTIVTQPVDNNDTGMVDIKKELLEKNKELCDLRAEFKISVDNLSKDKTFYQKQCEVFRKSERQMREELGESQKENSTFKKEIQRLFEESCAYQQELHDKSKELDNLKEMIIEKDNVIDKKNKQLADLRIEFNESMEILTKDKTFYQNQCELSQESKSKIGKNLMEVQIENTTLKSEIKRLYDECCAHQVKIHEQAKESESLKEIIIEKDLSINNLEKCNDAMKKKMKAIEKLCR